MVSDLEKKQVLINDLLLTYYASISKKSKESLLFLHGWRSNSTLWFKILPAFIQAGYSIYCVDLPGFGQSETQKKPYHVDDFVDTVEKFIKKLELKHISLIGHSFGGKISIKLAVKNPQILKKLILVDSSGIKPKSVSIKLKQLSAKFLKPLFKFPFMSPLRTRIYELMGSDDYVNRTDILETYLNTIKEDVVEILPSVQTKTLIIWGKKDKGTPIGDAEIMHKLIPNSQLVILDDAGHFSFLDQPESFTKAVLNFIKNP